MFSENIINLTGCTVIKMPALCNSPTVTVQHCILVNLQVVFKPSLRMLDAGLTYLDAGLVYLDADLCTNQEWIRCRFGIFRRRFGINRCSFVKFLGENLCQLDAQK